MRKGILLTKEDIDEAAVIDTCLLINWSRFVHHDLLKKVFQVLYMPEITFQEIKSTNSMKLAAKWMTERFLVLTPVISQDEEEVMQIIGLRRNFPEIPTIDPPETYALVLARKYNCPLLTDNKAPKVLVKTVSNLNGIRVLDSLDLLLKIPLPSDIGTRLELIDLFMQQTSFKFSKKRLRALINEKKLD